MTTIKLAVNGGNVSTRVLVRRAHIGVSRIDHDKPNAAAPPSFVLVRHVKSDQDGEGEWYDVAASTEVANMSGHFIVFLIALERPTQNPDDAYDVVIEFKQGDTVIPWARLQDKLPSTNAVKLKATATVELA